jgi:transposase-like protein
MFVKTDPGLLEQWAARLIKLVREGYAPPGKGAPAGEVNAVSLLARELGKSPSNMRRFVKRMQVEGLLEPLGLPTRGTKATKDKKPEPTRAEVHDASFWKKRHTDLTKNLGEAEHLVEQLMGIRDIPYSLPTWIAGPDTSRRGRSVIGALLSDIHMGEVISAEEIQGINAFDIDICRDRLERYFRAVCTIGQRWASDTDCDGAFLALAGDLISGDIHDELRMTNALTSHEQVQAVVESVAPGIRMLKETFGRVHVVVVPGNHGRTTHKPTAKLYSRLSYDSLVGSILAREFGLDQRVTFQMTAAKDQITPIYGRTVLTTHGDKIGTKGGMGFAGPMLPIVRGSKKIEAQQAGIGRRPDLIQFGHYHTTGNPGFVLANGSVPGYSEYGDDLRAVVEPPQQWMYLLHSRWWLRERMPVQLEEPKTPPKPVVRVPAGWSV